METAGYHFADPCQSDVYRDHLKIQKNGKLKSLTLCGAYRRDHLRLDRTLLIQWRTERHQLLQDMQETEDAVQALEKSLIPKLSANLRPHLRLLIQRHTKLCARLRSEY
jgi:hypothetical protein